jgi:hypothetical protein
VACMIRFFFWSNCCFIRSSGAVSGPPNCGEHCWRCFSYDCSDLLAGLFYCRDFSGGSPDFICLFGFWGLEFLSRLSLNRLWFPTLCKVRRGRDTQLNFWRLEFGSVQLCEGGIVLHGGVCSSFGEFPVGFSLGVLRGLDAAEGCALDCAFGH